MASYLRYHAVRIPVVAFTALFLIGCSPSSDSAQQSKADKALEEAVMLLSQAPGSVQAAPGAARDSESDRAKQLADAAAKLQEAANSMAKSRQLAAKTLLAEINAAQARLLARQASRAWVQQSILSTRLVNAAGSLRLANQLAAGQGKVDFTAELTKLREAESKSQKEKDALTEKVAADSKEIQKLLAEQKQNSESRAAKIEQSQKIARQAFALKGKEQYEAYLQSTALSREADQLNSKSEMAAATLDILQSQHKLDQAAIKQLDDALASIKQAIADIDERGKKNGEMSAESAKRADTIAVDFKKYLEQFGKEQVERVNQPFEAAARIIAQAIAMLEPELVSAPNDKARAQAQSALSGLKAELGQAQATQALIDAACRDVLKSLADSLAKGAPEKASLLADSVQGAETRANQAAAAAKKSLEAAAADLKTLAEGSKNAGEKPAEAVALKSLIAVTLAGNTLEADRAAGESRIKELRTRLSEIEN